MASDDTETDVLIGYADQISVGPGESVRCMVSCSANSYSAQLVRLIHGDPHPSGPGLQQEIVASSANGSYPGRIQMIRGGSYIRVDHRSTLALESGISLQAWILPTTPEKRLQGLITKWSCSPVAGYGLFIGESGCLSLGLAGESEPAEWLRTGNVLRAGCWYFVAATFEFSSGLARLWQWPLSNWKEDPTRAEVEQVRKTRHLSDSQDCLCIAAFLEKRKSRSITGHYNGKIDSPRLFNRALTCREIEALAGGADPKSFGDSLAGAWDFSIGVEGSHVVDRSPCAHHGIVVNMPARAVTGHNWRGEMFSRFQDTPDTYGAIHFHDDDLGYAGWQEDFSFRIPEDLGSGIYAIHLKSGSRNFHIPFIVKSKAPRTAAPILFLAPTFTWQAYANFNEMANRFNLESSESSMCKS